ncbi:MAG: glycerophosphodiester phosphodiesterase family protein [Acutalibacteraceae bacterium]
MSAKSKSGKKTALKVIGIILAVIVVFAGVYIALMAWTPEPTISVANTNSYITTDAALVSAHRSGGGIMPENTMLAFESCMNSTSFNTDIFEFDLHITKDDKLILLHDDTLDRTTNAVEHFGYEDVKPIDHTYAELRELNFGENFQAADGSYPYRGLRGDDIPDNLRAVLLEDVLDTLEKHGQYSYIIEIKDGGEDGMRGVDILYDVLEERGLLDRVIFGTFNGEVTEYVDENYPDMLRSASISEVLKFYGAALLNLDLDEDFFKYDALQIPANQYYVIRLGTKKIVNYAHRYNIAVQYWTINDPDEIKRLNDIGADAIISDTPDVAYSIIKG